MVSPPSTSQPLLHSKFQAQLPLLVPTQGRRIQRLLAVAGRGRPALSVGKSAYGTSLFASKSITAEDCILKVPYSVQLAPDNLVPELKDLL